jgi:hypothetical protein
VRLILPTAVLILFATSASAADKDTRAAAVTRGKKLQAKVSVEFADTSLKEALAELKTQIEAAGQTISWRLDTGVSMNLKVMYSGKDVTVAEALDGMFAKNGLGYVVISKEGDRLDGFVLIKAGKERGFPEGTATAAAPKEAPAAKAVDKKPAMKDKPAPKPEETGDKAEQLATGKLKLARQLEEAGKTDKARERYQDIIKQYPSTKAAEEARDLLEKLKK